MKYKIDVRETLKELAYKATKEKEYLEDTEYTLIVEKYADILNDLIILENWLDHYDEIDLIHKNIRIALSHAYWSFEDYIKDHKNLKKGGNE